MTTPLSVGIIGLDTSHAPAFTGILNDEDHEYHVTGARVVGAYPGGSMQFSLSRDRVQGFTEQLKDVYGVKIYDAIPDLVEDVDAVLLESVDGRKHLAEFTQAAVGKPVYIDKPLATSTADARAIIQLAEETGTPLMSCSSLRYAAGITGLLRPDEQVLSCEAFGPAAILEDYPGLFWYGIHSAEVLFSQMGPGCQKVRCIEHPDTDVVIGEWDDGRIGVLRGTRVGRGGFGCVVHSDEATNCAMAESTPPYYALLMQEVIDFFRSGESPIDIRETWDIIAFLEAADQSRALSGEPVETASL
ncbi:MAG: Gfo/Idh/MocA family protein [Anaerolineae bacterium]